LKKHITFNDFKVMPKIFQDFTKSVEDIKNNFEKEEKHSETYELYTSNFVEIKTLSQIIYNSSYHFFLKVEVSTSDLLI